MTNTMTCHQLREARQGRLGRNTTVEMTCTRHALDRERGTSLEACTEMEGTKYTAGRWSKDLKRRGLDERSGNSHTSHKLHKETEGSYNELLQGGDSLRQEKRGSGKSWGGRRRKREVELGSACRLSPRHTALQVERQRAS